MDASATLKKLGLEQAFRYIYKDPESAEHLCSKCDHYAACWEPTAQELWQPKK